MNILVLGGTGAMGNHLVKLLANDSNDIYVTSRKKRDNFENVHYIEGNAQDINFLIEILKKKWDVIVDFMVYSTDTFQDRLDILLNWTKQYVFFSSSRVYADSALPMTEEDARLLDVCKDSEYLGTDEYALAKARQENLLMFSNYRNWTIVRPYITYAEERLQLGPLEKEYWLYRGLHNRSIVFSEEIFKKKTTLTYGKDVAIGIKAIIGNESAYGETYHITTTEFHSWEEIFNIYDNTLTKLLGSKLKIKLVSNDEFMKCYPGRYQILYDRLYDRKFDNSKIGKLVDTSKFISPKVGLSNCLESFVKKSLFLPMDWRIHACMDKLANEYTELAEIDCEKNRALYMKWHS